MYKLDKIWFLCHISETWKWSLLLCRVRQYNTRLPCRISFCIVILSSVVVQYRRIFAGKTGKYRRSNILCVKVYLTYAKHTPRLYCRMKLTKITLRSYRNQIGSLLNTWCYGSHAYVYWTLKVGKKLIPTWTIGSPYIWQL